MPSPWRCAHGPSYKGSIFGTENVAEARDTALSLAKRAAILDSEDPFVLASSQRSARRVATDMRKPCLWIERTLAIDPNSAFAWQRNGWVRHDSIGEPAEAIRRFQRAVRLNPFDPYNFIRCWAIGSRISRKSNCEQGVGAHARDCRKTECHLGLEISRCQAYVALDRMPEAKGCPGQVHG